MILQECCYYTAKEIAAYRQKLAAFPQNECGGVPEETAIDVSACGSLGRRSITTTGFWRTHGQIAGLTNLPRGSGTISGRRMPGFSGLRKRLPLMKWRTISTRARRCWKHLYQLVLRLTRKLELSERHRGCDDAGTEEDLETGTRRGEPDCGEVRERPHGQTMFDRNPVRRMESAGELLNGWKQEYRKML
ncbi:MAG: hypothetical protein ACLT76_04220 [Clostridium fessum]